MSSPLNPSTFTSLPLTAALTSLNLSIRETVTSLYALHTAFINARNASGQLYPDSNNAWSNGLSNVQLDLRRSDPFHDLRLSFHDLLGDISVFLRKAHGWVDNPMILCQFNRRPIESSEVEGIRQFLLETYEQAILIQEASEAVTRRCQGFILEEFERTVKRFDVQDLLSGHRPDAREMYVNVGLDPDSEAFVRANLLVLFPDGMNAIVSTCSSLAEMHRALLNINGFWDVISQTCRSLVQQAHADPTADYSAHASSYADPDHHSPFHSHSPEMQQAQVDSLRAFMYERTIWMHLRKDLSSSISSLNKMTSLLLVAPSGAPVSLTPAPSLAMVSRNPPRSSTLSQRSDDPGTEGPTKPMRSYRTNRLISKIGWSRTF